MGIDSLIAGLDNGKIVDEKAAKELKESVKEKEDYELVGLTRLTSSAQPLSNHNTHARRDMVEKLDPNKIRRWDYSDRFDESFNFKDCEELIKDIKNHGQEIPAVVRRLKDDPDGYEYEVIYGCRRHYAASHLTNKEGIKTPLLARVLSDRLDNEAAAKLMDLENRSRQDITPYERCVSYRRFLGLNGDKAIYSSQKELLEALALTDEGEVSKATLSQMVAAGELNEVKELGGIFKGQRHKISWTLAYKLMQQWHKNKSVILNNISSVMELIEHLTADDAIKLLMDDGRVRAVVEPEYHALTNHPKLRLQSKKDAKKIAISIPVEVVNKASKKELLELLKGIIYEN